MRVSPRHASKKSCAVPGTVVMRDSFFCAQIAIGEAHEAVFLNSRRPLRLQRQQWQALRVSVSASAPTGTITMATVVLALSSTVVIEDGIADTVTTTTVWLLGVTITGTTNREMAL
jgi:hypothetical protein